MGLSLSLGILWFNWIRPVNIEILLLILINLPLILTLLTSIFSQPLFFILSFFPASVFSERNTKWLLSWCPRMAWLFDFMTLLSIDRRHLHTTKSRTKATHKSLAWLARVCVGVFPYPALKDQIPQRVAETKSHLMEMWGCEKGARCRDLTRQALSSRVLHLTILPSSTPFSLWYPALAANGVIWDFLTLYPIKYIEWSINGNKHYDCQERLPLVLARKYAIIFADWGLGILWSRFFLVLFSLLSLISLGLL